MEYKQIRCLNCGLPCPASELGICNTCRREVSKVGGFSSVKMNRLYGLSKDRLKKLKKSGDLIPIKLDNGNWQFSIETVEGFFKNNPEKLEKLHTVNLPQPNIKSIELSIDNINYSSDERPSTEDVKRDIIEDFDLLSKQKICELFKLSSSQFDEIVKNFVIYETSNGRNKKYHKFQIMDAIQQSSLSNGKWSQHFTKCRECGTIFKNHYASGYCVDCYPNTQEFTVLREYLVGKTFAEIGRDLNLSRERIRQMFEKAVRNETENITKREVNSNEEAESIREAIKEEARKNSFRRKYSEDIRKALPRINEVLSTTTISSSKVLLARVNISSGASFIIDEDYPDLSRMLFMNGNQWSTKFEKCVVCGTTDIKHRSNGMCEQCYRKSDTYRENQMKWRRENYEKFRESQRRYEQEYYQRPEVKKRQIIKDHQKRFGSNIRRELAIKAYGNSCGECSISRKEHKRKFGQDISVIHINGDLSDNSLENLKPLCKVCSSKQVKKLKV